MSLVYSTVDCAEVLHSRRETGDIESGYSASIQLEVDAANKDALVLDILSNQRVCPFITGSGAPRANTCAVEPIFTTQPANGQGYDYNKYHVTVNYSNKVSTIVVEEIEPIAEFLRLDHRFFRWSSDAPLHEGEAPGFLYQSMNLVFKYVNKSLVPTAIITGPGKVHNASWTSPTTGLTFPAETLLFCPGPLSNTYTTGGSSGFSYATKFAFRPNGWNKTWRPSTMAWESIYLPNGTQYKSYPPADLSALLP